MKTENLRFTHSGNGVVVCDISRVKDNDYLMVAHIAYRRRIRYYTQELSNAAKTEIKDFATCGNMAVSATQPDAYALCPLIRNS